MKPLLPRLLAWFQALRAPPAPPPDKPWPPRVLAAWLDGGADPPPPDAEARVAALEARYGVRAPDDFRRYLLQVAAPAEEALEDYDLVAWWPLDRIRSIPDELADFGNAPAPGGSSYAAHPIIAAEEGSYLFFADYLVWCWAWAICCSEGPNRSRVARIGEEEGFVADSFTEFVEAYLRDSRELADRRPPPD